MLKVNKNLTDAMKIFNTMSLPRAEVVLSRIFIKPGASCKELFTEEEIKKFNTSMKITEAQLANIVNAFCFVLLHATAERDIAQVEKVLTQSGLGRDHHQIFTNIWADYGNEYSLKIREIPVAVRDLLHSFNWNMTLQIEESRLPLKDAANFMNVEGKIDNCEDLYSFDARNPVVSFIFQTKQSGEDLPSDKFNIKFQKSQIQDLFEALESIQDDLDALM